MISEISKEEFLKATADLGDAVDRIRIKSILACYGLPFARTFSSGGGYLLLFGKTAFVLGKTEDIETLRQFLFMNGIAFVSGETEGFFGEKKVYSVLRTEAEEVLSEEEIKLSGPAKLMSQVFGYDFNDVYPDMCLRKNRGAMRVLSTDFAAAAIHKTDEGNLLTGVCVKEGKRGKGKGSEIVNMAKKSVSGELYIICEESLRGFYEKSGFKGQGNTEEIIIGD